MTPPTIGELNPEIAKKLGLDEYQIDQLAEEAGRWEGRIILVTFVVPPPRTDGKKDPIAYLPPSYQRFGVVDRDHRQRVNVGETWLVETVQKGPGTLFLVPLLRLDPKSLLELQPSRMRELADHIAVKNPSLAKELAAKLPAPPDPVVARQYEEARATIQELQKNVDQLSRDKASLETQLGQLTAMKQTSGAPASAASGGPNPLRRHPAEAPVTTSSPRIPASPSAEGITLERLEGEQVHSTALVHLAYEIHFTGDLYRIILRPSPTGVPCDRGKMVLRGLSRVDHSPPPATYSMFWDERLGGFVAYIGQSQRALEPITTPP